MHLLVKLTSIFVCSVLIYAYPEYCIIPSLMRNVSSLFFEGGMREFLLVGAKQTWGQLHPKTPVAMCLSQTTCWICTVKYIEPLVGFGEFGKYNFYGSENNWIHVLHVSLTILFHRHVT